MQPKTVYFSTTPVESAPVVAAPRRRILRARFDAAQTTASNSRHWSMADALGADAATNSVVRQTLRMRGQYEYDNNGYCQGAVNTVARDIVGTGPQLQLRIGNSGLAVRRSKKIEKAVAKWSYKINLADKLRLLVVGKMVRGETLAKTFSNGGLGDGVDLDCEIIEADQLVGQTVLPSPTYYDGIWYDTFGNPSRYEIQKATANASGYSAMLGDVDTVDAKYVYHYFKRLRAGQRRGISELTPGLPLFAQLRRYALATLDAAETAANHSGIFEDTIGGGAQDDGADDVEMQAFNTYALERNGGLVVPPGYTFKQLKAEQPTATYSDFEWCLLRQVARALDMPVALVALDSSRSNLASRYVDDQHYARARKVDRFELEGFLDWLLSQWISEAAYYFPELRGKTLDDCEWTWRWPAMGHHADPSKVAAGRASNLANGLTNFQREYAEDGLDAEAEMEAQADILGLSLDEYRDLLVRKLFANGNPTEQPSATPPAKPTEDDEDDAPVEPGRSNA